MSDYIEVDGLRVGPCMWRNAKDEITRLQSEVERLRGRCAELEKDAARYQYIRNNQYWTRNSGNEIDPGFSCVGAKFAYDDDFQAKPMLDHHIDRRLRQQAAELENNNAQEH